MNHTAWLLAAILAPAPVDPPAAKGPAPAPAVAPDAGPLPSPADARSALDRGDAAEALRIVSRLLALRGKAAEGQNRYALALLKADAHLRLRAGDAAALAFKQAAGLTDNREEAAVARASEQLVRRSRGLAYAPRRAPKPNAPKPDPIDVVDPAKRQAALRAMFADDMADLVPKLQAAKAAKTLPPALKAMQAARELATLELAANGSADQSNGAVEALKQSAKRLLESSMEAATKRVDQITLMANDVENVRKVVRAPFGGFDVEIDQRRRGIRRQDVVDLKATADTCDQVAAGAKAVAQASGSEESEFEDLVNAAGDLRMHVRRMLRTHDIEY